MGAESGAVESNRIREGLREKEHNVESSVIWLQAELGVEGES